MVAYPRDGGGIGAVVWFVALLLIGAVVVGLILGNSELINPSLNAAKVDKLQAEADAIRAESAYQERKHEMELQALQDRRTMEKELLSAMIIVGTVAGTVAALIVAGSVAYYMIVKAQVLNEGNGPKGSPERDPGLSQIKRANVSPCRPTYDGLLAYCYDFLLYPDGTVMFYPKGISPDVAGSYLALLRDARIVIILKAGRPEWVLHPRITSIDAIRARISRQAFDRAAGLYPTYAETNE